MDRLPVSEITRQYLGYLRSAPEIETEIDVNEGAEFFKTASWLVLLKSRRGAGRREEAAAPTVQRTLKHLNLAQEIPIGRVLSNALRVLLPGQVSPREQFSCEHQKSCAWVLAVLCRILEEV